MIAVIFASGAIIYELSESQADEFAKKQRLISPEPLKYERGWIFPNPEMPYILNRIGIDACYMDLNSFAGTYNKPADHLKISIGKLIDIWGKVCPIGERITAKG